MFDMVVHQMCFFCKKVWINRTQKIKFSFEDFLGKWDQIRREMEMEGFISFAVHMANIVLLEVSYYHFTIFLY